MVFGFYGYFFFNPSLLLSWMFEHDCLDTCCFGCACILYFCMCTCSVQLSMFPMERHSRNTLITIIINKNFRQNYNFTGF